MGIVLNQLVASGPGKLDATISFHQSRCLIRGPSDTGKSYIRDCLWYLLGGEKLPKSFPESEGYQFLMLEFTGTDGAYQVERAATGGDSALYKVSNNLDGQRTRELIDLDENDLLVTLAGAEGREILRSASDKGAVTGGDLRHWSLISQPTIISEEPTSGVSFDKTQRLAAFNLFLTGNDDAAVELRKSNAEVERIKGQMTSAEDALKRTQAGIPPTTTRKDVEDGFERVNATLNAMTTQYEARAAVLREIRSEIADVSDALRAAIANREHSASMVERFRLLDKKYSSDLERLGATIEGVGFLEALPLMPCPLCATPSEQQIHFAQLKPGATSRYRQALAAESDKITVLRRGLTTSLERECSRFNEAEKISATLKIKLSGLEDRELKKVGIARSEFAASPKSMAQRHSELSAQLGVFDEIERLTSEIQRLKRAKTRKRVGITREGGEAAIAVATYAKHLLNEWGFIDITSTGLDASECDLIINNRPRLSFGAGKRALFLTALIIALLQHALDKGNPHLGVVVVDSPLKAYADPNQDEGENIEVAVSTVTDKFYSWLAQWNGPGQIVILENEEIRDQTAKLLDPIQFTGVNGDGRAGFYPTTFSRTKSTNPTA